MSSSSRLRRLLPAPTLAMPRYAPLTAQTTRAGLMLPYRVLAPLAGFGFLLFLLWSSQSVAVTATTPAKAPIPLLQFSPDKTQLPLFLRERLNPLDRYSPLPIDDNLSVESLSPRLATNQEHSLVFHCAHDNITRHCPPSYRLWFVGPTLLSPLYSASEILDDRRVRVSFNLRDPGQYELYVYPEHVDCDLWNHGEKKQYHRMAVKGSPLNIEFVGPAVEEGSEVCQHNDAGADAGRWVSRAHINPDHLKISSPHWWWLHTHLIPTTRRPLATFYSYIYVPYACKKPHHSFREWIDIIKPKHLMVFGDSVLRDLFCLLIYTDLGAPPERQCTWNSSDVKGYHTSNKNITSYIRQDGGTTKLTFKWLPNGDSEGLERYLKQEIADDTTPTHISFGVSLWLAKKTPEQYAERMRPTLEVLSRVVPEAKIASRTSGGVVQAIECYDQIGGQRGQMEGLNDALKGILVDFPRVRPFDAYRLFNDRPDASTDGRHWSSIGFEYLPRPEVGSVEYALADELFFSWLP